LMCSRTRQPGSCGGTDMGRRGAAARLAGTDISALASWRERGRLSWQNLTLVVRRRAVPRAAFCERIAVITQLDGCSGAKAGEIVAAAKLGRAVCKDITSEQAHRLLLLPVRAPGRSSLSGSAPWVRCSSLEGHLRGG
jgi:hypothetical protein